MVYLYYCILVHILHRNPPKDVIKPTKKTLRNKEKYIPVIEYPQGCCQTIHCCITVVTKISLYRKHSTHVKGFTGKQTS